MPFAAIFAFWPFAGGCRCKFSARSPLAHRYGADRLPAGVLTVRCLPRGVDRQRHAETGEKENHHTAASVGIKEIYCDPTADRAAIYRLTVR